MSSAGSAGISRPAAARARHASRQRQRAGRAAAQVRRRCGRPPAAGHPGGRLVLARDGRVEGLRLGGAHAGRTLLRAGAWCSPQAVSRMTWSASPAWSRMRRPVASTLRPRRCRTPATACGSARRPEGACGRISRTPEPGRRLAAAAPGRGGRTVPASRGARQARPHPWCARTAAASPTRPIPTTTVMQALFAATPAGETPACWMIADRAFVRRYGLGRVRPRPFPLRPWIANGISSPPDHRRARRRLRHRSRRPRRHHRDGQSGRGARTRHGLRPRRQPLQPRAGRPDACAEPLREADSGRAVPCGADRARQPRDVRRARHRRRCAGYRLKRRACAGALRGGRRHGEHDARPLSGRRDHARAGHDLRLHRGPSRRRRPLANNRITP